MLSDGIFNHPYRIKIGHGLCEEIGDRKMNAIPRPMADTVSIPTTTSFIPSRILKNAKIGPIS